MASAFGRLHKHTTSGTRRWRILPPLAPAVLIALAAASAITSAGDATEKRWKDDELVASYRELLSGGRLEAAVRTPALPTDPPQASFLEALAWYAAGAPKKPGVLILERLDARIAAEAGAYIRMLKAKVEAGEDNDYPRTRTWKLIQKYTLLRDAMTAPEREGRMEYRVSGTGGSDAWDRDHTLRSPEEFAEKVCRASYDHPVLVKYGNTNCTQCMLFELIGSVQHFADHPDRVGKIDVYKVWWGMKPDDSFAGRIRDPQRLDALARAEGVQSSPTFVAYRNGRRTSCGDAFPDDSGRDERLETCLSQDLGAAPASAICEPAGPGSRPRTAGR
jgi:hypothetical protein